MDIQWKHWAWHRGVYPCTGVSHWRALWALWPSGWGRLKDTLASPPDGLSGACQMAVTATCPSLRTVTTYKQTITLICECTVLCECVYDVCMGMITLDPLNEHDQTVALTSSNLTLRLQFVYWVHSTSVFLCSLILFNNIIKEACLGRFDFFIVNIRTLQ